MKNLRSRFVWAAVLGAWVVAAPVSAVERPDAWITAKTKLSLLTADGVTGTEINVDTVNGQVTLHGKVNSAAEKDKAEALAKTIEGAKGVRNLLQVVAPKAEEAVQVADDDIKQRVEKALKANKSLDDSSISVQSVNKGVVLLAGKAATVTDHLNAVMTAATERGVKRVASEIESPDKLSDAEIWRDPGMADSAKETAKGAGETASDMWITSAAKLRLIADSATPAMEINVDTTNGEVILFGMVPTAEAKAAAEADVRKVSGVKKVRNELQVVAKANQETVKARDEDLQAAIKKEFSAREPLKDVEIEVKNGVVQLKGTVPSANNRLEAAVVARSTAGVRSVNEHLRIAD